MLTLFGRGTVKVQESHFHLLPGPTDNFLDFSLSDSDEDSLRSRLGEGDLSFMLSPGDGLLDLRSTWLPM